MASLSPRLCSAAASSVLRFHSPWLASAPFRPAAIAWAALSWAVMWSVSPMSSTRSSFHSTAMSASCFGRPGRDHRLSAAWRCGRAESRRMLTSTWLSGPYSSRAFSTVVTKPSSSARNTCQRLAFAGGW
ncbi:hypothetical protein ADL19_23230 [Streptomyces purpurogeneiscleroticus]|nr:hypothetical protein ADL19_23230 [Streptomyces purpurogeneiscleroticus]